MTHTKANLILVFVAMVWGGGFITTSKALESFSPFYTIMIRFGIAGIVLGILSYKDLIQLKKKEVGFAIITGAALFGAFAFQTIGLQYTTASKNAFLTAVNVVFVPYLMWLWYRKRPSKKTFLTSILCFIGVTALTLNGESIKLGMGEVYSLLGALFFAIHILCLERGAEIKLMPYTCIQMSTAGFIGVFFALTLEKIPIGTDVSDWFSMLFLIFFSTLMAYLLQTYAQKFTSANEVSMILSCEAVFASIFSFIFLNEQFTLKMLLGIVMIFCAIIIQNYRKENKK